MRLLNLALLHLRARLDAADPEAGVGELSTSLGIAAVSIVALVAIGAGVQALGLDVIDWARDQLIGG